MTKKKIKRVNVGPMDDVFAQRKEEEEIIQALNDWKEKNRDWLESRN